MAVDTKHFLSGVLCSAGNGERVRNLLRGREALDKRQRVRKKSVSVIMPLNHCAGGYRLRMAAPRSGVCRPIVMAGIRLRRVICGTATTTNAVMMVQPVPVCAPATAWPVSDSRYGRTGKKPAPGGVQLPVSGPVPPVQFVVQHL